MNICVFCGSNPAIGEPYVTAAREVGQAIGQGGHTLVFGGFEMGLMGEVARAAKAAGARVIGVVPKTLVGAPHRVIFDADELIQTVDLAQRKRVMEDAADGFISLAGAYGTLDELYEVLAMRKAAQSSSSVASFFPILRFVSIVPERSVLPCGTYEMNLLEAGQASSQSPHSLMYSTEPASGFTSESRSLVSVVLPAPEGPTTPTMSPGSTCSVTCSSTLDLP